MLTLTLSAGAFAQAGPRDWSFRHVITTNGGSAQTHDLRARSNAARRARAVSRAASLAVADENESANSAPLSLDWTVQVGTTEHTAIDQFPAKFSFDTGTPTSASCATDYTVFTLTAPAGGHANILAINNLYQPSGSATGQVNCGGPTTMWAYETGADGAQADSATSPALSWDGSEVAFVDNSSPDAVFHVLKWTTCSGCSFSSPAAATHVSGNTRPGGDQVHDLVLTGGGANTRSSPYIDYDNNAAYVGTDTGKLYKIKDVFACIPNALVLNTCNGTNSNGPSIDTTFGTNGFVQVGATNNILTGPIFSPVNGIVVGGSDGNLYLVGASGVVLRSITVGDGSPFGGVVESPIVDVGNGAIYATSGSNGTDAVIVEASLDLTSTLATGALGPAGLVDIRGATVDDAYFTSPKTGHLYACGILVSKKGAIQTGLYQFAVGPGTPPALKTTSGGVKTATINASAVGECAPLTENVTGGTDRIFTAAGTSTFGLLTTFSTTLAQGATTVTLPNALEGTSGMVIDNTDAVNGNIYFTTLAPGDITIGATAGGCTSGVCAYKLTQSGLQ